MREVPRQPEQVDGVAREVPLVGEVVDGEDGGHAVEGRIVPVEGLQVDGNEAGLPVVGVDHLGAVAPAAQVFQRGPGVEREAHPVVAVVLVAHAVGVRAVEERRVLHEDSVDVLRHRALVEARAAVDGVHRHVDGAHEVARGEGDGAVARQEHGHAVPPPPQRLGQRRRDVGQAAGLQEGRHLRGD